MHLRIRIKNLNVIQVNKNKGNTSKKKTIPKALEHGYSISHPKREGQELIATKDIITAVLGIVSSVSLTW